MDLAPFITRARSDLAELRYAITEHRAGRGRLNLAAATELLRDASDTAHLAVDALAIESAADSARADLAARRARELREQPRQETPPPADEQPRRRIIGGSRPAWMRQMPPWMH